MEMEPASAESLLPMEVWGKVFQNSAEKDAWNFRLVCSAWRKELDGHYDKWTVRLDQNSPYFQNLLELKVKEARICDLSTPVGMGQEGTPRLFKHPELLEKLSIPQDSQICLENMVLLLNSCGKTIKHLEIAVGYMMDEEDENFDPTNANNLYRNGIEFTNLESLTLEFPSCLPRPVQEHTLFKVMFGLSTMSKIKSLTVLVSDCLYHDVLFSTILAFIAKNGTNLEVIKCHLHPEYSHSEDGDDEEPAQAQLPANSIDLARLRQVLSLQKIEIHYYGVVPNESIQIPCETLMEAQRNLTDLTLTGIHISLQSVRRVCYNNLNTLTIIGLIDLDFDIDLAILAGCMHLKELRLFRGNDSQGYPALQNARSLPVGIQKFKSHSHSIESEDILNLFTGHGELVDISLYHSGSAGSYGVTAAVFALFVINRDLSNKLESIYIRDFNCSTAGDVAALNAIFRGLKQEHAWEDRQDFRKVFIRMTRTLGKGGGWSVWKTVVS